MATTTHVPLEVYLHSSYEPDAEFVDGEIEERPMGENDHSAWQGAIFALFHENRVDWGIRVRPEIRVQVAVTINRNSGDRVDYRPHARLTIHSREHRANSVM